MLVVRKLASFSPWFKAEIYFLAPSKNEGARSYYNNIPPTDSQKFRMKQLLKGQIRLNSKKITKQWFRTLAFARANVGLFDT